MLVTPDVLASRNARLPEDADPQETSEWLDAMEAVIKTGGPERAQFLLQTLIAHATKFGRTSLTMRAQVRNMITRELILSIDKIVFVNLDKQGRPTPHGYTEITYDRDRIPTTAVPIVQELRRSER